ncbi:MAG: hypothetical protein QNJ71_11120 [Acidimicrobiia bacterium]|nr:hypothetical protein [Acidimicrobiia bacterium]
MRCLAAISSPIYNGRDNIITLVLIADGVVVSDLSAVTRVIVELDANNIVDSNTSSPGAIRLTEQALYRGELVDVLRLQLGGEGLTAGEYPDTVLTIFDSADYLDGLRMENNIKFTVID